MKKASVLKLLSILLVLTLAFSLSACGSKNEPGTTAEKTTAAQESSTTVAEKADPMGKYEPGIEFTAFKMGYDGQANFPEGDSYEKNLWTRSIKETFGIEVKYEWVALQSQYDQKLSIAIASNTLPELIPVRSLATLKQLVKSGVAMDLAKIINDYASPFVKSILDEDAGVALSQLTVDGKIAGLPQIAGNTDAGNALYIRKDWLANVGISAPESMDDLIKVAYAFTQKDPDKNGKNDTFGLALVNDMFGGMANLDGFFAAYGAYPQSGTADAWIKDSAGNLVNGSIQPEVKPVLAKLAEMYRDGVMDKEFTVKDQAKVAESVAAGKAGIIIGPQWVPFYPLPDSVKNNQDAEWLIMPLVSANSNPVKQLVNGSLGELAFVVNSSSKHPEAAMKIYNYYYSKDCALSEDFDNEYHSQDNNKYPTYQQAPILSFHPAQNISIYRGVAQYFKDKDASKLNAWTKGNAELVEKYQAGDKTAFGNYFWAGPEGSLKIFDDYIKNDQRIVNGYIKADTDTMGSKGMTLKKLRLETFTQIVMGAVPVDEFDNYVANWKKLGGDQITVEVNANK